MSIYVSCPWSFSDGLEKVIKYLSNYEIDSITYNKKGVDYDFSLLEKVDYVIFVLENFKWQEKLENISRGMLSELVWCLNNRKPIFIAYRSADGLKIYSAEITDTLVFQGIARTSGNIFKILKVSPSLSTFGTLIVPNNSVFQGTIKARNDYTDLSYKLEEEPTKNYFY